MVVCTRCVQMLVPPPTSGSHDVLCATSLSKMLGSSNSRLSLKTDNGFFTFADLNTYFDALILEEFLLSLQPVCWIASFVFPYQDSSPQFPISFCVVWGSPIYLFLQSLNFAQLFFCFGLLGLVYREKWESSVDKLWLLCLTNMKVFRSNWL